MLITLQVILIILMVVGVIGAIGDTEDKKLRDNMTAICISAIIASVFLIWIG